MICGRRLALSPNCTCLCFGFVFFPLPLGFSLLLLAFDALMPGAFLSVAKRKAALQLPRPTLPSAEVPDDAALEIGKQLCVSGIVVPLPVGREAHKPTRLDPRWRLKSQLGDKGAKILDSACPVHVASRRREHDCFRDF